MISILLNILIALVGLFLIILLLSLMLWVVIKILRALFPHRFAPGPCRRKDEV